MYEEYQQEFRCWNGKVFNFVLRRETADYNSSMAILDDDEYGLKDFQFNDGDIVLDVGAYIGNVACFFARHDKKIITYAFEPLPENVELLKKNLAMNMGNPVIIYPCAVGGEVGTMDIFYPPVNDETGRFHYFIGNTNPFKYSKICKASQIDLKTIFAENKIERCKLLKLDAEKSEYAILEKCPPEILEKIDWIIGEHHWDSLENLFKHTKGLFDNVPCRYQTGGNQGHFRFKNKRLK